MRLQNLFISFLFAVCLLMTACSTTSLNGKPDALSIEKQGSFAGGGTMITNPGTFDPVKMTPDGQTFHGDHASVFYQIPPGARPLPLVLWHGFGQSSKTWQSTPDGCEGYIAIVIGPDAEKVKSTSERLVEKLQGP